jgi:hypothetical protein
VSPLDRRVLFVTGKGGVGKSTVAAALARARVRRGKKPLLVRLSAAWPAPPPEGVTTIDVQGVAALSEYLETEALPPNLARRVTRSAFYRQFVGAAPGLSDLMAVGKILHEARRFTGNAPTWDGVIVDTPASGHIVEVLRMPRSAAGVFGGLVRREAQRLVLELCDPATTAVLPVALAEELAVNETLELVPSLARLGLPLGPTIVNRLHGAPLAPDAVPVAPPHAPPIVVATLRAARAEAGWAAVNDRQVRRLVAGLPSLPVLLPFLFAERIGAAELDRLGEDLERQLRARPEAA